MSIPISMPSFQSLFVQVKAFDMDIATATAFVLTGPTGVSFLITNRHVVTGRHQDTGKILDKKHGAVPTSLVVSHNSRVELGHFVEVEIPLYRDGKPTWIEHLSYREAFDVVALPIHDIAGIKLYPYDLSIPSFEVRPSQALSIVGFPYGERTARSFAVWSTGFVATEPAINHGGLPIFLIDCRARPGQSGSPVIFNASHPSESKDYRDSEVGDPNVHFFGVYSGRINDDSDLGRVWKASYVVELVFGACAKLAEAHTR